jgi:hypothetical protein
MAGTYNEHVAPANSGTSGNPITFQNYGSDSVTVDGSGISLLGIFDIENKNYITVSGLTLQNANVGSFSAGVFIFGTCDHITITHLTIYNTTVSGIWAGSAWSYVTPTVTNLLIDGCNIHHTNTANDQEGISIVSVNGFEVRYTKVYDMVYMAGAGIDVKLGSLNGSVHHNDVSNCPGVPLIYVDCAGYNESNISIYDNDLHDGGNTGQAMAIADEHGVASLTGISIYNNIFSNCQRGFAIFEYKTGTTVPTYNFLFINNTLSKNGDSEIYLAPGHGEFSNCIIRNTIIDAKSAGIVYSDYAAGSVIADHNLFNNCPIVGSGISGNPLFVSTTNFNLQTSSPAIGAGSATGAPTTDYTSTLRASPPCIGAYEYVGNAMKGIVYDSQWHAYDPSTLTNAILNRDFAMFKQGGITYIQIPLYWNHLEGDTKGDYTGTGSGGDGSGYGNPFLAKVKHVINVANSYGLKVYLEFHTLMSSSWNVPAYVLDPVTSTCQELAIVRSPAMQTAFINTFRNAVSQLAGTPGIWAWGINEPWYYPWTLPAPYQDVDQEVNFIAIFSQMKAIANAAGYPFGPKFVSNGSPSGTENVFTDDFSSPTHNGNTVNLWASIDFAGFDSYIPDEVPADIATWESINTEDINLCINNGKQVWITEFGSDSSTQAQDYQNMLSYFATLPIQGVFAWEWCSDGTEANPNPGLGGYNICASVVTGAGNAAYGVLVSSGSSFIHGTTHTATFPVVVAPSGLACQVELYLGPNASTKSATTGLVAFTSTGASKNLALSITMPAAGIYNVYINAYANSILAGAFEGASPVTVV